MTSRRPVALEFDHVTFGYGRTPVLREACLRVAQGRFVAVVGANGSGKTTLLKLGLGLLRPAAGTVRLFGQPVQTFRDWPSVGYVPQRAAAASALPISVEEVVRSGLAGRLGLLGRPSAEDRDRVEHVTDLLGVATLRRSPITRLSGGQQQRVLLARALVTRPRLLVLDEPTTGVDAGARSVLRESLEHLVAVEGVAVTYISHDPEGFSGLADQVLEVCAGRVIPARDDHEHPHLGPAEPSAPARTPADGTQQLTEGQG